jgi:hypothetical protein
VASIDETLEALVVEAGPSAVQRLRGAPFDAARAQRLFDALTGQRELTPPPAPRPPETSEPPDEVTADAAPAPDPVADDGEDHADDFVEIDDESLAGSMNAEDLEDDDEGEYSVEVMIEDDIAVEAVDELAEQIEELASQHGAMRDVLEDSLDHESADEFFAGDDELEDDDDTGTVQVKLPEEHEAPKPDRKKGMRSSVKKLFRK